jgi:acyl carrier protein
MNTTLASRENVISIIAMVTQTLIEDVASANNLKEDIGMDSLHEVEIVMEIEKELNIIIPDEAYGGFTTIDQFVKLIEDYK